MSFSPSAQIGLRFVLTGGAHIAVLVTQDEARDYVQKHLSKTLPEVIGRPTGDPLGYWSVRSSEIVSILTFNQNVPMGGPGPNPTPHPWPRGSGFN